MMSGEVRCTVLLDSIELRVSEIKHMIEVKTGIPRAEQDIYLDGCPSVMQDECRLCLYAEALYGASPRLCLVRRSPLTAQLDRSQWKRLKKEYQNCQKSDKLPGCAIAPVGGDVEANPLRWTATINGPSGSPYEGGEFTLDISLPHEYPYKPPLVIFATPIFHPLVSSTGSIDVDMLHESWVPIFTLEQIVARVKQEMVAPYTKQVKGASLHAGCGNHEAALLSTDKEAFDKRAREDTMAHACTLPGFNCLPMQS
jgi:ubiquitin-protein ligase